MSPTSNSWYSAPEVVPDSGLHHINTTKQSACYSAPEVVPEPGLHYIDKQATLPEHFEPGMYNGGYTRRICGLKLRTFWISLSVVAAMIVLAAVGGGVGASVTRHGQDSQASSTPVPVSLTPHSSESNTPTPSSTKSASVTATEVIGPTSTLFRDCPASEGTSYDVTVGPRVYTFQKFCNKALIGIGGNVVSTPTNDLNNCINQCAEFNFHNNTTSCNTVCWWNASDPQYAGQCWGFTTQNSSSGFQFVTQPICDSAGWTNEP